MSITEHEDGLYPVMMAEQVGVIGTERSRLGALAVVLGGAAVRLARGAHESPHHPALSMTLPSVDLVSKWLALLRTALRTSAAPHNAAADEDQHPRAEALEGWRFSKPPPSLNSRTAKLLKHSHLRYASNVAVYGL